MCQQVRSKRSRSGHDVIYVYSTVQYRPAHKKGTLNKVRLKYLKIKKRPRLGICCNIKNRLPSLAKTWGAHGRPKPPGEVFVNMLPGVKEVLVSMHL